jgi:integration host factor subunit beta
MTRSDLVRILTKKSKTEPVRAELIVEAVFHCFATAMHRGEHIEIRDLGSFHMRSYKGYLGRNPRNGTPIEVKPKRLPYFKPSKTLSGRLNDVATRVVPSADSGQQAPMTTDAAGAVAAQHMILCRGSLGGRPPCACAENVDHSPEELHASAFR